MKQISVTGAEYITGYKINIHFNTKQSQVVDFENWLNTHPHPSYNQLKDVDRFKKFYIDDGNLVWDENWNLIFNPINLLKNDLETDFE